MIQRLIKNFRISHRMIIFFQIMFIPLVILFVLFLLTINMLNETENNIMLNNVASIRAVYNVETTILRLRRINANYIIRPDKKFLDDFAKDVKEFNHWYNEAFTRSLGKTGMDILSNISIDFSNYLNQHSRVVELINKGYRSRAADIIMSEGNRYYNKIYENCQELIEKNDRIIDESQSKAAKYLRYSKIFGYSTMIVFVITGFIMLMIITRSITDPIRQIEKESGTLERGEGVDELERIRDRFHAMVKTLKDNQTKIVRTERRAAIGQIAAGISHELNNPIEIISGFAEMLLRNPKLSKKDMSIVEEIYRESQRCRVLLGDLLNFAKAPNPVFKMINPVQILNQTIHTFQKHEKYNNIRFTITSPKRETRINADRMQLEQV